MLHVMVKTSVQFQVDEEQTQTTIEKSPVLSIDCNTPGQPFDERKSRIILNHHASYNQIIFISAY